MENTKQKKLSVRIAIDKNSNIKGTGVLFLRNDGDSALIFSVAHIFDGKLEKKRIDLFLNIIGEKDQVYSICESCKVYSGEGDVEDNDIIIHPEYEGETLSNDIAIIKVKWKEWMREFHCFEIESEIEELEETVGWGFPAFMMSDQDINEQLIPQLEASISGTIETVQENSILMNYKSQKVEETDRGNETIGFSGTAMFSKGKFVGCISKLAGNDNAGSRIFLCRAKQYLELMNKCNLTPKLPDDLSVYGKNLLQKIPLEKKAMRNYVDKQIRDLIKTKRLEPCNYMENDIDNKKYLKCDGFRESCGKYWEGELISAFCFVPLKGVNPEELTCFYIEVKKAEDESEKIRVVFACTESTMRQSIRDLMKVSFFNRSDQNENGVLFLWNNQNDDTYYHGVLSKSDSRNIVQKITEDYLDSDVENVTNRMDMFHIVDGDNLRCNIAAIGIGRIWDGILSIGEEKSMKKMLNLLIESVWS